MEELSEISYCHQCTQVFMYRTHYSCKILKKPEFPRHIFEKYLNIKSVRWEPTCSMRTVNTDSDEETKLAVCCYVLVCSVVEHVWNAMAHAQKPDLVFQRNGRVHLNRRGSQFSRLPAVGECGSAGRPWLDHVPRHSARVVATLSNCLFPLHFPFHASPCDVTFRTAPTLPVFQRQRLHLTFIRRQLNYSSCSHTEFSSRRSFNPHPANVENMVSS